MNIKNGIIAILVFCWFMYGLASMMVVGFGNPGVMEYIGAGSMVACLLGFVFTVGASIND